MACMETMPSEVVHGIFDKLDFYSAVAFRMQSKRYAEIGAEHLVTRIRFFTEKHSLKRLIDLAEHTALRKSVKTIAYEGNLLALRCEHAYFDHFREIHHGDDLPEAPPRDATDRAKRLYKRSLAQWEEDRQQNFNYFQYSYDKQQELLLDDKFISTLALVHSFPNVENIELSTLTKCGHLLSARYVEEYPLTCAMPMDVGSNNSSHQLRSFIFPQGIPLLNLKSLHIQGLDPKTFTACTFGGNAIDIFRSLKSLHLVFRLDSSDRLQLDLGVRFGYDNLAQSDLKDCLAAATDLEDLLINYHDFGYYGPTMDVSKILGNTTWPKLRELNLDCMKTGDDFLEMLQRQPVLEGLSLCFWSLDGPLWADVIEAMKSELSLKTFSATGLLEDNETTYDTTYLDKRAYDRHGVTVSMTNMLKDFVLGNLDKTEEGFNPLQDVMWEELEALQDGYGSFSDMDVEESEDDAAPLDSPVCMDLD